MPLGPVYQPNGPRFAAVVNQTVQATILADDKGITSANVVTVAAAPDDAATARLLSGADELVSGAGLAPDAFYQVIAQVGNYGEIYARHLDTIGLPREGSLNAAAADGGLIQVPLP